MTEAVCNVIDLSNFTGEITDAIAECWWQAGIRGAVVGCQNVAIAIQQANVLLAAGFTVELYAFMYWGASTITEVQKAIRVAVAVGIVGCRIWLDCEAMPPNEASGQTPVTRVKQLTQAVNYVTSNGYQPGIYTGAWYWPTYMGNTTQFNTLPLWHAGYPDDHSLETTVNYGGWTAVAMHQFEGSVQLCGATIDEDDDITGVCSHVTQPTTTIDVNKLAKVMLRGLTDPQTKEAVDVSDVAALERVLDAEDMGGLGVANALQATQMGVAELTQGKVVPPHTHVAGAVSPAPTDHTSGYTLDQLRKRVLSQYDPILTMRPPSRKLGKLPYRHDSRTLALARYVHATPPTPPATLDLSGKVRDWPVYGNDKLGDCTCAAAGHMVELWTAEEACESMPSQAAVESMYWAITGGQDTGAVELDVLRYWRKYGLAGHRPYAFALVDHRNHEHVKLAASLFGGVYIGLALPLTAQQETGPQGLWDVPPADSGSDGMPGSWGGHAVNVVGYSELFVTVVTWGQLQRMTWRFWDRFCDEAWAILPAEWRDTAPHIKGFNFDAFAADLRAIGQEES